MASNEKFVERYTVGDVADPITPSHGVTLVARLSGGEPFTRAGYFYRGVLPRQFSFFAGVAPDKDNLTVDEHPVSLLRTADAAVAGFDAVVLTQARVVDRYQLDFLNYGREGSNIRRTGADVIVTPTSARRMEGQYFLSFNAAYSNYAHWLSDQWPLVVLFHSTFMARGFKLVLPDLPDDHFVNQMVRLLGIPEAVIYRMPDEVIEFETLYFSSRIWFERLPRFSVAAAQPLKMKVVGLAASAGRRLFVSRQDSSNRRLLNEDAVFEALRPFGIERIAPGLLGVEEQIRLFDAAELVVAPHGAGLANLAFCRPGAAVVEVFSEYTVQSHFWNLASHAGLHYGYLSGTSFDQDWSVWSQRENWGAPYVVEPQEVVNAARKALQVIGADGAGLNRAPTQEY